MAEKTRDSKDAALRALFASEAIADDGFSARVVGKIRRGQRMRRWCLGTAVAIGGAIACKPVLALAALAYRTFFDVHTGLFAASLERIPSTGMMVAGVALFVGLMLGLRMMEE